MTREQAKREVDLLDFYLQNHTDDYGEQSHTAMMMAIKALEQQTVEGDCISRQAVKDKLLKLCNELEGIFANIRMQNQDESVCGLCEYDCPAPYECPGFDNEDCFKLADEIRHKWQSTKDLPPVKPQYTDDEIQKMQDLEQAEIEKAYEIGKTEKPNKWIPVSERLPEENGQYIITVKYKHEEGYEDIYAEHGEWNNGKWDMFFFGHCGEVEKILAWMPLPTPYEPQESEG